MEYFIMLILLILGVVIGFLIRSKLFLKLTSKKTDTNINAAIKEIVPAAEYASLVYHYSSVITHKDIMKFLKTEINIPFSEKKAIYTIDGTMKLGFNGKNIGVKNSYNNIIIHMPKVEIISYELYPETFSLYDEKTSLFNRYSLKDANEIQLTHKNAMLAKIRDDHGLFTQARESAEQQFRLFLENLPEIRAKYKIVFEWEL
ncbi:DUF4230 domain-containing protein [Treponema sp. OttesenSCG-928-L16]|nr:DUF4230 domain-containing protein [Treponema sp. OttesenSCG-928-L16]